MTETQDLVSAACAKLDDSKRIMKLSLEEANNGSFTYLRNMVDAIEESKK